MIFTGRKRTIQNLFPATHRSCSTLDHPMGLFLFLGSGFLRSCPISKSRSVCITRARIPASSASFLQAAIPHRVALVLSICFCPSLLRAQFTICSGGSGAYAGRVGLGGSGGSRGSGGSGGSRGSGWIVRLGNSKVARACLAQLVVS